VKLLQYWLARLLLAARLPPRVYGKIIDLALPRLRRTALRNLQMAGFDEREHIVDCVFESVGRLASTFVRFPSITRETVHRWIRYDGLENFTAAHAKGKGVLVATAHLGNWELSAYAHALMTAPMHVVVRPLDNPWLDAFVERHRGLSGNSVIRKKEAAREILRALSFGDAVGILIDQNVTPSEGVFIDFFGVKACAGTAFVKFAHHTGAAVVPGFALWSPPEGRYVLRFCPEVAMSGDVLQDTQRVHSVLESVIREHPDQWLWIHRRWKTRPPGEAAIY
jgi:KDO2-lipid IV(A) lauroyltransferase